MEKIKYVKIYNGSKSNLIIVDTILELQYIKELIYFNSHNSEIKNKTPEIMYLNHNFNELFFNDKIIDSINNYICSYFNKFDHIIVNVDYSVNIYILSNFLKHFIEKVSTFYPTISNDIINITSYKDLLYKKNIIYDLETINKLNKYHLKNIILHYYADKFKEPVNPTEYIVQNIYENYLKIINIDTLLYNDGLTFIEREVINYILNNNIKEITITDIKSSISNNVHEVFHGILTKKIKDLIEKFSYTNSIKIFLPKTYVLYPYTKMYINTLLLDLLYFNNTYFEFKNNKFYISIIPLIFFNSKNYYQYNILEYIDYCIGYIDNKPVIFDNISLQFASTDLKIIKEKNSVKMINRTNINKNILYGKTPILNEYKTIKKYKKIDPNFKYVNNSYIFSTSLEKQHYISKKRLSQKILYSTEIKHLHEFVNNIKQETHKFINITLFYIEFSLIIKILEYFHLNNLNTHKNILLKYFEIKFNNTDYYELGLIFPFNEFYNICDVKNIFNNYNINFNINILDLVEAITDCNFTLFEYNKFYNNIYIHAKNIYIKFLNDLKDLMKI